MGTIFEELIRRFNEENNEEAGEHFTPRDVVKLMANLILLPIAEEIEIGDVSGLRRGVRHGRDVDGGRGDPAGSSREEHGKEVGDPSLRAGGQPGDVRDQQGRPADEGRGREARQHRRELDARRGRVSGREFDFMLSNPPYGKSWKSDLDRWAARRAMSDPRFVVEHRGDERVLA